MSSSKIYLVTQALRRLERRIADLPSVPKSVVKFRPVQPPLCVKS